MAVSEKIVHKIQLLLNLGKNNPNKEEAQTALLMAQRFMAEHGVSQTEVDAHEDSTIPVKKVTKSDPSYENRLVWWKKSLSHVIAKNFRCYTYISRRVFGGSAIVFLGLDQDVKLAKMTFEFACDAINHDTNQFIKETIKETKKEYHARHGRTTGVCNDYRSGWIQGLKAQFDQQVNKNNWGLILVKDALVTQEYESINLRKGRASSIISSGSSSAHSAGYKDGKNFSSPKGRLNS